MASFGISAVHPGTGIHRLGYADARSGNSRVFEVWNDHFSAGRVFYINAAGDVVIGSGSALATSATLGFLHVPAMAGAPSGVPSLAGAGLVSVVYDTTNHKLMAYSGSWRGVTLS